MGPWVNTLKRPVVKNMFVEEGLKGANKPPEPNKMQSARTPKPACRKKNVRGPKEGHDGGDLGLKEGGWPE